MQATRTTQAAEGRAVIAAYDLQYQPPRLIERHFVDPVTACRVQAWLDSLRTGTVRLELQLLEWPLLGYACNHLLTTEQLQGHRQQPPAGEPAPRLAYLYVFKLRGCARPPADMLRLVRTQLHQPPVIGWRPTDYSAITSSL